MHSKDLIKTIIITLLVVVLCGITYMGNNKVKTNKNVELAYQVYLNGDNLGLINNDQALYDLINEEQNAIKEQYNVDNVYPPNNFYLLPVNTYNTKYNSVKDVYDTIASKDDFTIKGYIVTIKYKDEEKEDLIIRVLDKKVFEQAIKRFILAFIDEEDYNNYINNSFEDLNGIGMKIDNMYFDADISIKEGYVSIKEKIYTDIDELSQFLLFGKDAKMISYVVKAGDDIESVSEEYKLNPEEFIIANPSYRDEKVMLKIGDKVNVTLLNPVIDYVYEVDRIEDTVVPYTKQKKVDNSKTVGYSEITQGGVAGLTRNHEKYLVKNGEQSSQVDLISSDVIREPVNEITIVGPSYSTNISGSYVDIPGDWGWPTNQPSRITSRFSMRWGKLHEGIDISGTGEGSPIYSIGDGVVLRAIPACKSCATWANGNYVIIQHANNYYSLYAHMREIYVKEGQEVSKGDKIGAMGHTGYSFGTHLHLSLFYGAPISGGGAKAIDPMKAIYNQ